MIACMCWILGVAVLCLFTLCVFNVRGYWVVSRFMYYVITWSVIVLVVWKCGWLQL